MMIHRKVTETDNYLGLTRPLHVTCNICYNYYNAVIHMETYHHDSRYVQDFFRANKVKNQMYLFVELF